MTGILPEVHSLLGRAATGRFQLLSLVDVLEEPHFRLRAEGDAWTVHDHLAHVAAVDGITTEIVASVSAQPLDLTPFLALREPRRLAFLDADHEPVAALARTRETMTATLAALDPSALSSAVVFPAADAWAQPVAMQLRSYLVEWAIHDRLHEASIREAVRTAISPAALALAARARR